MRTVLALLLLSSVARADFQIVTLTESDITNEQKLFLDNAVHNTTFTGSVGSQSGGPLIDITPNTFPTTVGNGWSTIQASQGGLTSILFTPQDQNLFTGFSTRGQLFAADNVTITVTDNFAQTFTFTENKGQDWPRIGVQAIPGTGEFISSVLVSSSDSNIKELKQIAFSTGDDVVINPTTLAPEPSTLALALIGLAGLGIHWTRVRRFNEPSDEGSSV